MTTFQLMTLRFLRMKEEFPHLNHRGHEPTGALSSMREVDQEVVRAIWNGLHEGSLQDQRERAEREFYRPVEKV